MSIMIRDMEMPKNCKGCRFKGLKSYLDDDGDRHIRDACMLCGELVDATIRSSVCPLIEVPKHGRLIDADAFEEYECHHCDGYCDVCECNCLNCKNEHRCSFMQDLDDAPTIIEAVGEE